jgi:hypothetical protein
MIELSEAAFNHQSMSFKAADTPGRKSRPRRAAWLSQFDAHCEWIAESARHNPKRAAQIHEDDARSLTTIAPRSVDLVVTSPPYSNRMSYVRELRPYMYWTGHLTTKREAGELDWRAIGGTWGIATSRLQDWKPMRRLPRTLERVVRDIRNADAESARLLGAYVARYFDDMDQHLRALSPRVRRGGRVHYIVGNSTFYGRVVSTEELLGLLLERHGFHDVEIRMLRKRNSKKELYEFDVVATKG